MSRMEPKHDRDLITGQPLTDAHDEPALLEAEELLLGLGYRPEQVAVGLCRELRVDDQPMSVRADLLIKVENQPALVMRCARGSLVTREREAVATARLISDPWTPLAGVFNGEGALLLEVGTGQVLAEGLQAIPGPQELARLWAAYPPHSPTTDQLRKAAGVYQAYSGFHCEAYCPA